MDATAFVVWDVGRRSPVRLIREIARGFTNATAFVRGVLRFAIGAFLLLLAARFIAPTVSSNAFFSIAETWTLFAALTVEWLVGEDLRAPRPRT